MSRGRKKAVTKDFRKMEMTASEAMLFLELNENNAGDERFFHRLVEEGFIKKKSRGIYFLGEVLLGFLVGCSEKKLSIKNFILALSDWKNDDENDDEKILCFEKKKRLAKRLEFR